MKKTLSLILALVMILSMSTLSVYAEDIILIAPNPNSAPEGTAITNAAEFAAMAADGKYYLANDITLEASYAETFKGTLDGNGKTVTVSAPIFAAIDGATVKNLTVAGAVDGAGADTAAVAVTASGTLVLENIVNKASVSGAENGAGIVAIITGGTATVTGCENHGEIITNAYAGGLIAKFGSSDSSAEKDFITIDNCKNYGAINCAGQACGGILGLLTGGAKLTNCENHAKVLNTSNMAGGIFGTCIKDLKNICGLAIENCVNYGEVSASTVIAGIAARLGRAVQHADFNYHITNCANFGTISSYTGTPETGISFYIAGITGYAYGGSGNEVSNCVNAGDIIADTSHADSSSTVYVGSVIAYVNSKSYTISNNINAGSVTLTGTPKGIGLIAYNKNTSNTLSTNNYSVESVAGVTFADADSVVLVTADQLASGEVAYLANEAAGATVFYQSIGTDKAPVLTAAEDGSNTIIKNADGTFGNPVKEPETTEPEVTEPETTEPVTPPTTGDASVIFAVIAVISVFGVAVVAKRREF